ncbi:LLM class flavin-dependent oxidoreductase [Streptomyces sp. NPDC004787]|uniref:LLM class flavin-dependent oxidoreductase n=1 Tax=Streptomyces sp. NPDC004787 TaxID=3154291 RepID=UPI0033A7606B
MEIGLVLPTMIRNCPPQLISEWSRIAESTGFSSVAVFDRIVYDCYEPLTALAAAAAVTERVRLTTALVIAPVRTNTSLLAKQAATVDHLSGGRLTLGLGAGVREDDFIAGNVPYRTRGADMDDQISLMQQIWKTGDAGVPGNVGPVPARSGGPELILGGHTKRSISRAARFADGWIAGSGGLDVFLYGSQILNAAWKEAGRNDAPRRLAVSYFSLGSSAADVARNYLSDYLDFAPSDYTEKVISSTPTDGRILRQTVQDYADSGCDELLLAPCLAETEQLELLIAELGPLLADGVTGKGGQ